MYYSIILSMVSSTKPEDVATKEKLRCNLWLAMNDVRLFLEPSEPNIQALAILATHVEEFTSPSLCWMLIANACRMLQALGINLRHLSPETRQRRIMTFWYLNLVDKGLSIIFGRPPTLHRAMSKDFALPTVAQLLPYQPHNEARPENASRPGSLFGAHYIHQIMLLSHIIGDIWSAVYENASRDEYALQSVKRDLEEWYSVAKPVRRLSVSELRIFALLMLPYSVTRGRCNSRRSSVGCQRQDFCHTRPIYPRVQPTLSPRDNRPCFQ